MWHSLHATARDGTQVPISVVHRKDTPLDGSAPLLLYGYGSIARRLAEMLGPMHMNVIGVRRNPRGDERIHIDH